MSNYRNHLIEVNLQLTMLTAGIGIGTFFAGVFGMNLCTVRVCVSFVAWRVVGVPHTRPHTLPLTLTLRPLVLSFDSVWPGGAPVGLLGHRRRLHVG